MSPGYPLAFLCEALSGMLDKLRTSAVKTVLVVVTPPTSFRLIFYILPVD